MEILVSPGTIMPRICDECPQDTYCSALCTTLFIRQKMSDIVCCFVHFYIVSADCMDRIALDEIGENRRTGDLIRT